MVISLRMRQRPVRRTVQRMVDAPQSYVLRDAWPSVGRTCQCNRYGLGRFM